MAASLNDLATEFRSKVSELLQKCADRGAQMVPNESVRSPEQQAIYWRQSRSTSQINQAIAMLKSEGASYLAGVLEAVGPQHGDEVTQVLPGNSWHQWGEAVDCFWEVNGQAEWSTTKKVNGINGYQMYAQEAKNLGLTAGLLWPKFKDAPHVQLRADNNPRSSGLGWPQIDQAMRDRFGGGTTTAPYLEAGLQGITGAQDPIRLSYAAPEGWRVYETTDTCAAVFRAKMAVDADGAPKAYNKNDSIALDYLANAGRPGNWWALVTDAYGKPIVQGAGDPAPGYYVSTTTLTNPGYPKNSPAYYVDASTIPFIVLPGGRYLGFTSKKLLRLGDLGVAYNIANGKMCFAQFCETGPAKKIGEASIALAEALGINPSPKHGGVDLRQIVYVVFASSGPGKGLSVPEITAKTAPIFEAWGGMARISSYGNL
jgi:hypothetical protein